MGAPSRKLENTIIKIISIGFVMWSVAFIYRSSFIAIDGRRYFCLFDDAMISMKYAWNFSHGMGLVWNPGEYIQGYSNLLMTLLMSFATLIFDKSIAALSVQISGIVIMLMIAHASMRIADLVIEIESHQRKALVRVLSFSCALFYYPLAYWSLMGMETGLLTLLLLLGVLSALKYTISLNFTSLLSIAGYLGLAYLTRNDSLVFAIFIWLYIIMEIPNIRTDRRILYQFLGAIGLYFLFVVGQSVFQYLYYGSPLPNTYTLKLTGMPLLARIANGFWFVKPFLTEIILILVISGVDLVFDFRKRKLLLFSLLWIAVGYQIYIGGDAWDYWRIVSPTMPLLTILFIGAVNVVIQIISGTQAFNDYFLRNPIFPGKYATGVLVTSLTLIGLLSANSRFLGEISLLSKPYQAEANQSNVNIAIVLNQITTKDASVGVFWAGSIPYFADRNGIDFLGKSDRHIANLPPDMSGAVGWNEMTSVPGHNKYDLDYSIKTLKPTYVQGFNWGTQHMGELADTTYIKVEYEGVNLFMLRDSTAVLWDKVSFP